MPLLPCKDTQDFSDLPSPALGHVKIFQLPSQDPYVIDGWSLNFKIPQLGKLLHLLMTLSLKIQLSQIVHIQSHKLLPSFLNHIIIHPLPFIYSRYCFLVSLFPRYPVRLSPRNHQSRLSHSAFRNYKLKERFAVPPSASGMVLKYPLVPRAFYYTRSTRAGQFAGQTSYSIL